MSIGDGLPVLMIDRPERKINMNIIETNIANIADDKKTLYKLTRAKGLNIKDLENGERVPVDAWALYTDVNTKGTEQTQTKQQSNRNVTMVCPPERRVK